MSSLDTGMVKGSVGELARRIAEAVSDRQLDDHPGTVTDLFWASQGLHRSVRSQDGVLAEAMSQWVTEPLRDAADAYDDESQRTSLEVALQGAQYLDGALGHRQGNALDTELVRTWASRMEKLIGRVKSDRSLRDDVDVTSTLYYQANGMEEAVRPRSPVLAQAIHGITDPITDANHSNSIDDRRTKDALKRALRGVHQVQRLVGS
jgi:hypothetical protein